MEAVKRYHLHNGVPYVHEDGDYVVYPDHLAVVESLRTELNHSIMAADSEARFADEMKAERDALRKQLEEKDADIERAVEIALEESCFSYPNSPRRLEIRAAVLAQVKEQGK